MITLVLICTDNILAFIFRFLILGILLLLLLLQIRNRLKAFALVFHLSFFFHILLKAFKRKYRKFSLNQQIYLFKTLVKKNNTYLKLCYYKMTIRAALLDGSNVGQSKNQVQRWRCRDGWMVKEKEKKNF